MPDNKLHIISFDVPYPPDYGGVIDVFYKVKALHDAGIDVYLHCFAYGRKESDELKKICKEVWYYPRTTGIRGLSLSLPYIVNSRKSDKLLERLYNIEAPIFFDGVHTCYYLNHLSLKERKKAIRPQNIEADYYKLLAKRKSTIFKQLYYNIEATLLSKYERSLPAADTFFTVSKTDHQHFAKLYPLATHQYMPSFHVNNDVVSFTGVGSYCLYHGNLSHPENIEAVSFLLKHVIPYITFPVIIAGKNPDKTICSLCEGLTNCTLIANPEAHEMEKLIKEAHIHLMPTFQASGLKLKLLYSLYSGRHIIANQEILYGTGLDSLCNIFDTADSMINIINKLKDVPFTNSDIEKRIKILSEDYDNSKNAQKIIAWMQA